MSRSRLVLNFSFCLASMMENAMAMVSSCMSLLESTAGMRVPSTRMTGWDPTLRWRSLAPWSMAIFNRSLMCMDGLLIGVGGRGRRPSPHHPIAPSPHPLLLNWRQPAVDVFHLALDEGQVALLNRFGDGAPLAGADGEAVHRGHGGHLRRGAREEDLVGEVQHLARDGLVPDRELHLLLEDLQDAVAGEAGEHRVGQRRRVDHVVADQEDVLAGALGD